MYHLLYHPRCEKGLRKLNKNLQTKIISRIEEISQDPFAKKMDIKKMVQTKQSYRLRLGGLRVIYELDGKTKTIYVQEIAFRGQIY